jgi:hypothetical protein
MSSVYYSHAFYKKKGVSQSLLIKSGFYKPILLGLIVELVGSVARISNSSIDIKVEIFY